FLGGGLGYLAYSMVVSWFLRRRIKQQVLAEALFELARYLRIKADFYDVKHDLASQFNQLVRQQIVVADKQQASRDLI
ncbi:FUSC family membrane protein, partial [Acinetobacter baumannii]